MASIESILRQFEDAWSSDPTRPPSVLAYIQRVEASHRAELAFELIAVDLEYRWRRAIPLGGGHCSSDPIPPRPRARHYWVTIRDLEERESILVALENEELRVRTRWGDRPNSPQQAVMFRCMK